MSPDQRKVLGGMAGGAAAAFCVLACGWLAGPVIGGFLTPRRIVALGLVSLALPLVAAVGRVAARGFVGPGIDGTPAGDRELDLDRRILANTLEQTVLAALAFAALVTALPGRFAGGALVYALDFLLARTAFVVALIVAL